MKPPSHKHTHTLFVLIDWRGPNGSINNSMFKKKNEMLNVLHNRKINWWWPQHFRTILDRQADATATTTMRSAQNIKQISVQKCLRPQIKSDLSLSVRRVGHCASFNFNVHRGLICICLLEGSAYIKQVLNI